MQVTIAGQTYEVAKLDPFKQFHLARRLAPAMWAMGAAAMAVLRNPTPQADVDAIGAMIQSAGPLVDVLAAMSDADSQYVLNTCLSACSRQSGTGYQKVFIEPGGLVFQDIDLPAMMQLVVAAIRENLGNFLAALPAPPTEEGKTPQV